MKGSRRSIAIGAALAVLIPGAQPGRAGEDRRGGASPLVAPGRVELTLSGASTIILHARRQAESMGLKVNITVVDDGGHPIAFARMDGARPASIYTSMTKAIAAATLRQPTGPVPPGD